MSEDFEDIDDYCDDEPCDHEHADFDPLIGRESCSCGWSRWLTGEEYSRRLNLEAQAQAEWDEFCKQAEQQSALAQIESFKSNVGGSDG